MKKTEMYKLNVQRYFEPILPILVAFKVFFLTQVADFEYYDI